MKGERVCIIVSPEFGSRLEALDKTAPIWIVQSPINTPVIAELWKSKTGNITSFRPHAFEELIGIVNEHHPEWRQLEVYGLSAQDAVVALNELNGTISPTGDGFLFEKSHQ